MNGRHRHSILLLAGVIGLLLSASIPAGAFGRPQVRVGLGSSLTVYAIDRGTPFGPFLTEALADTGEFALRLEADGIAGGSTPLSYRVDIEGELHTQRVRVHELSGAVLTRAGLIEGGLNRISQGKGFSAQPNCPFQRETSYYLLQVTGFPAEDWTLVSRAATQRLAAPPLFMLQLSRSFSSSDLELTFSGGKTHPTRLGGGWSRDFGAGWQAYLDLALRRPEEGGAPGKEAAVRSWRYRAEALAGLQRTNGTGTVATVEVFHSALGYDAARRDAFWQEVQTPWGAAAGLSVLRQERLGQDYAAVAVSRPALLSSAGWEVSVWINLVDGSRVWQGQWTGAGDGFVPVVEVERFSGAGASEFGSQARTALKAGFSGYF